MNRIFFYLFFVSIANIALGINVSDLTLEEKIGQLFMVAAVVDESIAQTIIEKKPYRLDKEYIEELITLYKIGGIIFLGKSDYQKQIERTQHFQSLSKIPLLIGQDLEPGRIGAARLAELGNFPNNQQLGLLDDLTYTYKIGKAIGAVAKSLGVDIVFAPVADVNNNPLNPIINDRSFGDNPELVAQHAIAFAKGLTDEGIIACAKHFPGHGDTTVDSHLDLPFIYHDRERLKKIELAPFKALIDEDIAAIMIAHLLVPALQENENVPASLSKKIVTDLLQIQLGFSGLIVTDALDMGAITKKSKNGIAELPALRAGNDMLLCPIDVPVAIAAIKEAINNNEITEEELDIHVEKILIIKKSLYT